MNQPAWQIKKEMCDIGNRIWMKGFCACNEGNHSVRISDDRVLCTPTGISKGFLTPEDICVVDMDGTQVEHNAKGRKRTSEVKVHLAIYRHRDDVKAVVHSHPPHATAFAMANIQLPAGIHPEAEVFLGTVPLAPYALPSTDALPDSIIPLIGPETNTVLMGNHGSVSFGSTLIDAYYKLEILDAYSRILLLTLQLGKVNQFTPQQMSELLQVKANFGLPDSRLECAADGCVTANNDDFLTLFDPADTPSASCSCNGGKVTAGAPAATDIASRVAQAVSAGRNGSAVNENNFEAVVQQITDQIMAARR